jgi:stress response protein YsnF
MAATVIGFFDNPTEAQTAVQRLESSGISRDRIDVSSGNTGTSSVNYDNSTSDDNRDRDRNSDGENGITRFFKNLFGGDDDDNANRYSKVAQGSNSIVTVHTESRDEAETAADILDDCGAVDVDERAAQYGYSNTGNTEMRNSDTDSMSERTNISGNRNTTDEDATINRIEENLQVGKRTVEQGGVRVRSRIVERPVEEHVRLREERINVERQSVDRPVSGDELSNFQEKEIELTERSEVPVVNKEARVVEEVRISKDVNEREETIRDTVRSTDVDIENIDKGTNRRTDTDLNTSNTNFNSSNTNLNNDLDDDTNNLRRDRNL